MGQYRAHRCLSRLAGIVGVLVAALAPGSASAHFGLEGTADLIVDYGLLALIGILVVGGAAVSAWLAAGSPDEEDNEDEDTDWKHSEAATEDTPAPPPVVTTHPTAPSAASDHAAQRH